MVASTNPLLKQITKRFSKGKKSANMRIILADLNLVQGLLLLLVQLGSFRISQAENLFRQAASIYAKHDARAHVRASKYLIATCLAKNGKIADATNLWEQVMDMCTTKFQKSLILTSLGPM